MSLSCTHQSRWMGAPALKGIIGMGAAEKIGGAKAHWPNTGWRVPALGPDCETGRRRAHLRFGRRAGWRVFEQARTMVPHHPRCGGRPERFSRADVNKPSRILPRRSRKAQKSSLRLGFLVKDSQIITAFSKKIDWRTFDVKKLGVVEWNIFVLSRRPRRRRVGRLVASVGTNESRSNEDVASLGCVVCGLGHEITAF